MSHYKSNVRDLEFNLFEVFGADQAFGRQPYTDIDVATARDILAEVDRLAREDLSASYTASDRNPPVFDPATYTAPLPAGFKRSYQAFMDSEFWRMDLPAELGGTAAPRALWWSMAELVLGANAPVWMYASGPSFAHVLHVEGTAAQRQWAKIFVDRRWGSTMVLTEPDAGSDVGAGRARAVPQPDGSWHIEGVKRFITSGEHDLTDNIIHYVLARPVGVDGAGGPGTKGLSLFVVPKVHFDPETGALGERNGVYATNVEHKMGIKVSNTCELTFGGHGVPARGWLLGDVHDGIRQMFMIIEYARMMVGTKAIATLSTGYLNALDYARNRVQGADLLQMADKAAPRVSISHHPDVRRSLLLQKSYAEGLRALVCYTATWQDKINLAQAAGDDKAVAVAKRVNDLLLPLVKGCGSERAYELLGHEALQIFGGSGFLEDYPLEQYVRDAKIDTLYEGTTAIQSLDLFFRKIVKDGGRGLMVVAAEIRSFIEADPDPGYAGSRRLADRKTPDADRKTPDAGRETPDAGGETPDAGRLGSGQLEAFDGRLKQERESLGRALGELQTMVATMTAWLAQAQADEPRALYKVGLHSRRFLLALGDVVVGWLLQRQAEVALRALAGEISAPDKAFYEGKVAAARFFAAEVLPRLGADRRVVEAATLDAMDLPEEAF